MPNNQPEMSWLDKVAVKIIQGQIRHALSGLAGILIANGAIQHGQETQFVEMATGIIMWAGMAAWSAAQKKGQGNV